MKLWAFDDAHNWGAMLVAKATARGFDARLFDDSRIPDEGLVFMHMHHHPQVRLTHKRIMAVMALNKSLRLIPSYRASVLFDDKIEQARQLATWLPRTNVFFTIGAAKRFLADDTSYPIISKAAEGTSSYNVRMINTEDEARSEIRRAYSDLGIRCKYGQMQRGYLLWQEFIDGSSCDYRIVVVGSKRLILRRANREDVPMGGAANIEPITELDDRASAALEFVNAFAATEQLPWCAVDVIRSGNGEWFVLEVSVSWTLNSFYEAAFFDASGERVGKMGHEVWDVFIDELEHHNI